MLSVLILRRYTLTISRHISSRRKAVIRRENWQEKQSSKAFKCNVLGQHITWKTRIDTWKVKVGIPRKLAHRICCNQDGHPEKSNSNAQTIIPLIQNWNLHIKMIFHTTIPQSLHKLRYTKPYQKHTYITTNAQNAANPAKVPPSLHHKARRRALKTRSTRIRRHNSSRRDLRNSRAPYQSA